MTQKMSAKVMRIVSYVLIVYSLIWATAPFPTFNLPARILLDILDWPFGDASLHLDQPTMWLSAIGSGLLLTVAIIFWGIIAPALECGDRQSVKVGIVAISMWYLVDNAGSLAVGIPSNVFFNTLYLVAILIPMVMVKYDNKKRVAQATR